MSKVTIAKVEGRAKGGGSEIALAVDMCFAAAGKAIFGHPGGGATQRLPRLIGRGRALEVLLARKLMKVSCRWIIYRDSLR